MSSRVGGLGVEVRRVVRHNPRPGGSKVGRRAPRRQSRAVGVTS